MNSVEIRQSFLDFFKSKQHAIVPSAPLLPSSPNLLFTNAGMNQFVPYFLEEREPPWKRAADTQKCIRAGGKHNDLEDVGFDTSHHTFFEMLGNWSFGDYFKKEAIAWAWELLTEVWGLPKNRLYATIYKPGPEEPAEFDEEAWEYWSTIFESESLDPKVHIQPFGMKDNFWMMAETGPCGPNSEIHIDFTPEADTRGSLVNTDSPFCLEVWNLVFIQYNAAADGTFSPLPSKHVDTGLGFDRIAGIFATTRNLSDYSAPPSTYDSDLFTDTFSSLTEMSGHQYQHTIPKTREKLSEIEMKDCAFRVLADHIRALSCSIADGILPGNDGRHYVLRRILRRAVLFSKRINLPIGSFSKLVDPCIAKLGAVFPELEAQREVIHRVISSEEETFERTIDRGLQMFDKVAARSKGEISGKDAFILYDTYGFPIDLTQIIARERDLKIDLPGFEEEMDRQRQRARDARKKVAITVSEDDESTTEKTIFTGYSRENLESFNASVIASMRDGNSGYLVFDRTPFYGEMGGQIGDTGTVEIEGRQYPVSDTIRDSSDRFLHKIETDEFEDLIGKEAILTVDRERRLGIQRHHTATHVLHWALRKVLGFHVRQAGSLVTDDRLRFDFSHFEQPTKEQLQNIETLANRHILENSDVSWYEVPFSEKPEDAIAFFGEKYGGTVRVVDIGGWSLELCGGTHVSATGELGLIKVVQESAIAAGTRRIEALVGESAFSLVESTLEQLSSLSRQLSCQPREVEGRVASLLQGRSALESEIRGLSHKRSAAQASDLAEEAKRFGDLHFVVAKVNVKGPGDLRPLAMQVAEKLKSGVVVLGCAHRDKVNILALLTPDAVSAGYNAGEIIRSLAGQLGGRGGGKPDFATGGGDQPEKLESVLQNYLGSVVGFPG